MPRPEDVAPARATWVVATGNRHKLDEFAALLVGSGTPVAAAPKGFAVDEDGVTFAQNAAKKAWALRDQLSSAASFAPWVLADDSGLVVPALAGAPGVRSARYAPPEADQDGANRRQLLAHMAHLPAAARRAHFVCALACIMGDGTYVAASGEVHGHIAAREAGAGGFGYDSLFVPDGESVTFAQAPAHVKASMSHRARAVTSLLALISAHPRI